MVGPAMKEWDLSRDPRRANLESTDPWGRMCAGGTEIIGCQNSFREVSVSPALKICESFREKHPLITSLFIRLPGYVCPEILPCWQSAFLTSCGQFPEIPRAVSRLELGLLNLEKSWWFRKENSTALVLGENKRNSTIWRSHIWSKSNNKKYLGYTEVPLQDASVLPGPQSNSGTTVQFLRMWVLMQDSLGFKSSLCHLPSCMTMGKFINLSNLNSLIYKMQIIILLNC